eukprot:151317-Chlamydomonas_euryale.AAC.22
MSSRRFRRWSTALRSRSTRQNPTRTASSLTTSTWQVASQALLQAFGTHMRVHMCVRTCARACHQLCAHS